MNNKVMFSSKNDIWETPQDFFEKLDEEFNFDCDVCALPENAKCKKYYTLEQDGLKQKWVGVCYMNPPYGKKIKEWVKKAYESDTIVVALLPARTDTKWFHDYIYGKSEIRFLRGRLKFGGVKNSAPFPSMVVIFNKQAKKIFQQGYRKASDVIDEFVERLAKKELICKVKEELTFVVPCEDIKKVIIEMRQEV